jgi:ubiquinone biosynthesis protein
MLLGFLNRDYMKVAQVHKEAGILPEGQSVELFAQACRSIGEPIFNLPQNEISIARLLQKLFKITEQFQMETQPQLLMLQKTMMMAEGIARKLNPMVNFWEISRDLLEDWGKENLGPKARVEEAYHQTIETIQNFSEAARNMNKVITPEGLIIHQQVIDYIRKDDKSENFWKGFITAILLSILGLLIVIKF